MQIQTNDIPDAVLAAGVEIKNWFESQNIKWWELDGICDRRFADEYHRLLAIIHKAQTEFCKEGPDGTAAANMFTSLAGWRRKGD